MYLLLIISSCLLCVLSTPTSCDALYQLDGLASCALHRSYQNYETYGCACSEISPNNPVDDIDRCCQTHNNCYNKLLSSETCKNPETPEYCNYQWSCSSNSQSPIVCYPIPDNNACLQGTCQCDAQLMTCLGQYPYPAFVKKCNSKIDKQVINFFGKNITIITNHHENN